MTDFHLSSSDCGDNLDSPCIDAGDPAISDLILDCDWGLGDSRSDIGAFGGGEAIPTGIPASGRDLPEVFSLFGNFPNPFNSSTVIRYELNSESEVTIEIYDILGRMTKEIRCGYQSPGRHDIVWNAANMASGTYFYRISGPGFENIRKMTLLK